jgi:hypothetical protein
MSDFGFVKEYTQPPSSGFGLNSAAYRAFPSRSFGFNSDASRAAPDPSFNTTTHAVPSSGFGFVKGNHASIPTTSFEKLQKLQFSHAGQSLLGKRSRKKLGE